MNVKSNINTDNLDLKDKLALECMEYMKLSWDKFCLTLPQDDGDKFYMLKVQAAVILMVNITINLANELTDSHDFPGKIEFMRLFLKDISANGSRLWPEFLEKLQKKDKQGLH